MKITEGYWRIDDNKGSRVCCVTKTRSGFRIDYVMYRQKENDTVIAAFITAVDSEWVTIPKPISEKEYFLAVLKGGASSEL